MVLKRLTVHSATGPGAAVITGSAVSQDATIQRAGPQRPAAQMAVRAACGNGDAASEVDYDRSAVC